MAGTLIDYETGVAAFLRSKLPAQSEPHVSNDKLLEAYARAEKKQQAGLAPLL